MKITAAAKRLGLLFVLLALTSGCNHMAYKQLGASVMQRVGDADQRPGSGITRYPVQMRDVRID